jgi:sulfite exporter TauE/SafE
MMFLFGLGTLPAMLATSFGAEGLQALLRKRGLKLVIALLLIVSGAWTLYITASHSGHSGHGGDHSDMSEPMDHSQMHHQ